MASARAVTIFRHSPAGAPARRNGAPGCRMAQCGMAELGAAWAISLAAVIFAGALLVGNKSYISQTEAIATKPPSLGLPVQPGTAVGDLQALERNDELYADFDVLDELQVQDDVTANP